MPKIAIIQFPGFNCEYETRRTLRAAGLEAEFFRWNDDRALLEGFDGYVIPGGFSYEDRGRAGLIASLDPAMDTIITQAEAGKPVLGICNGAQVLLETGLVPGAPDRNLLMCLARNKRVKNGRVLGTGFYSTQIHMKTSAAQKRTPFTTLIPPDTVYESPIAHGEGRFVTTHPDLLQELIANDQIVFRYCDPAGQISDEFPINPNGALDNMAALCNPAGNVMAVMPHPERGFTAPIEAMFESLNAWFDEQTLHSGITLKAHSDPVFPSETDRYQAPADALEFWIDLIITDNEAQSLQSALRRKGFEGVELKRSVHYEVGCRNVPDLDEFATMIERSGELFNPNKETVSIVHEQMNEGPSPSAPHSGSLNRHNDMNAGEPDENPMNATAPATFRILVRDREDFAGQSKAYNLQHHLGQSDTVTHVTRGTVWTVTLPADASDDSPHARFQRILATNIFYNHHAQTVLWI